MKKSGLNIFILLASMTFWNGIIPATADGIQDSSNKVNGDVYGQIKVIGDVDGDGVKDLVFGATDGKIHLYSSTGHEIFRPPYWPVQLDAPIVTDVEVTSNGSDGATKIIATTMSGALFCLDSKGKTEWVNRDACSNDHNDSSAIDTVRISAPVLAPSEDGGGEVYFSASGGRVFCVSNGITTAVFDAGGSVEGPPVLADINKDGSIDVITKNSHGKITVNDLTSGTKYEWDTSGKSNHGQWTFGADARDVTGDGIPEIFTTEPGNSSKFSLWNPTGKKLADFSISAGAHGAPQVADVDGDGIDDFIIAQSDGKILVCDKNGKAKKGWPYNSALTIVSSPQLVDMDGDGYPEIVFTGTNINGKEQGNGCVIALDRHGKMLEDFPKYVGKTYAKPTFADLDGDGYLEMIVAGGIGYTGPQIHIFRTESRHNVKIAVIMQKTIYK